MSTLQTTIRIDNPAYRSDFVHFLESASYIDSTERGEMIVVSHQSEVEKRVLGSFLRTWSGMFPEAPLEVDRPRPRQRRRRRWFKHSTMRSTPQSFTNTFVDSGPFIAR